MTTKKRPTAAQKKIAQLEKDLMIANSRLQYHIKVIKNCWWVLTDLEYEGLDPKIYVPVAHGILSDIACAALQEEEDAKN
jgi:hypothetical protein